jgi:predicted O-linked N-acetylglucosamine transferase (SPINDLY family)
MNYALLVMKQKKIKSVIAKKVKEIAALCDDISTEFDKDAIHKFRTTVKSLRSFLRLQEMNTGARMTVSKKFKRLYDIAGVIREAQLELEFLKDALPSIPHYTEHLYQSIEQSKQEWAKTDIKRVIRKLEERLSGYTYKTLKAEAVPAFFNARMKTINSMAAKKRPADSRIHDARKKIKDILYISKLTEKEWKSARKKTEAFPVDKLDILATIIGEYNDERMIKEHISSFPLLQPDRGEQREMRQIHADENRKLATKKKEIRVAFQTLIERK